jgi:hypothetical protein
MHGRLVAGLLAAKALDRFSGADDVTLRRFLLTVSAQDIAMEKQLLDVSRSVVKQ